MHTDITPSDGWLDASVYAQDSQGKRTRLISEGEYNDTERRDLDAMAEFDEDGDEQLEYYISFAINKDVFETTQFDRIEAYKGRFDSAEEAKKSGTNITSQFFSKNMEQTDAGYPEPEYDERITLVSYQSGKVTGCMDLCVGLYEKWKAGEGELVPQLFKKTEDGRMESLFAHSSHTYDHEEEGCERYTETLTLKNAYSAKERYCLEFKWYIRDSEGDSFDGYDKVTAAYLGEYASIAEAKAAGAADIKESLFVRRDYEADFSNGVQFTIFIGEDGAEGQKIYQPCIKTREAPPYYSGNTSVQFYSVADGDGESLACYVLNCDEDSYADSNYITILVEEQALFT